jgi:hypothetical protein
MNRDVGVDDVRAGVDDVVAQTDVGARLPAPEHAGADHDPRAVAEPGDDLLSGVHGTYEVQYVRILPDAVRCLVTAGEYHRVVVPGVQLVEGHQGFGGLVHRQRDAVLADHVGAVLGGHVDLPALFDEPVVGVDDVVVLEAGSGDDDSAGHNRSAPSFLVLFLVQPRASER